MWNLKTNRRTSTRAWDLAEDAGQEIAEAALVLPILFLVLLAIFWFGRAFNINSTVQRAARIGIQTATEATCVLSCPPGNIFPTRVAIATKVKTILRDDHLDPTNLTPYSPPFACTPTTAPDCQTSSNVEICYGVPLTCGGPCQTPPAACGTGADLGTRVSVGYRFTSAVPFANLSAITITGSAQSEPEQ